MISDIMIKTKAKSAEYIGAVERYKLDAARREETLGDKDRFIAALQAQIEILKNNLSTTMTAINTLKEKNKHHHKKKPSSSS